MSSTKDRSSHRALGSRCLVASSLSRRLTLYGLSAAGILATAPRGADAAPIYSPGVGTIVNGVVPIQVFPGAGPQFWMDAFTTWTLGYDFAAMGVGPASNRAAFAAVSAYAQAFDRGSAIPLPTNTWQPSGWVRNLGWYASPLARGGQFRGRNAYIGVRYRPVSAPPGSYYYGWIHVSVPDNASSLTVYGWAYESDRGQPIRAGDGVPEPSSLALLALGAAGVSALRRRRDMAKHAGRILSR